MKIQDLFTFQGRVSRATYALTGIIGTLIKHNIDRVLAMQMYRQKWGLTNYLIPLVVLNRPNPLTADEKRFLLTMALVAVPFIWVGIAMTLKRLRDAGLPNRLVFPFFIPAVNVVFFLLLCLLPSREDQEMAAKGGWNVLEAYLPNSRWGSAILGAFAGAIFGAILSWVSIALLGGYGFTLFLAIPFFMGYLGAWLYCYREPRSLGECFSVTLASVFLAGAIIVGIAFEGIFCVAMAAPIALPLALLGAYLAFKMQEARNLQPQPHTMLSLLLVIPLLAGAEFWAPAPTPRFKVHTSIEIAAPPEVVWRRMVAFPKIDEPVHWVFRLGMSYPLEARTVGTGLSADRQCVFSTGAFREPILVWDEGKHLAFGVSEEPPLMKEWSPYGDIQVRHLEDHDFKPERADFYLTALPGGRTRLDGWTTYENRMWPGMYWRLWTDEIVHQIHGRVFRHVKKLAEEDARLGARR
jgi:uncharacterized membrane protein YhaH (DUF805 family)